MSKELGLNAQGDARSSRHRQGNRSRPAGHPPRARPRLPAQARRIRAGAQAVAAHHMDIDWPSVEAMIVQAADAISAARPGARREILESTSSARKAGRDRRLIPGSIQGVCAAGRPGDSALPKATAFPTRKRMAVQGHRPTDRKRARVSRPDRVTVIRETALPESRPRQSHWLQTTDCGLARSANAVSSPDPVQRFHAPALPDRHWRRWRSRCRRGESRGPRRPIARSKACTSTWPLDPRRCRLPRWPSTSATWRRWARHRAGACDALISARHVHPTVAGVEALLDGFEMAQQAGVTLVEEISRPQTGLIVDVSLLARSASESPEPERRTSGRSAGWNRRRGRRGPGLAAASPRRGHGLPSDPGLAACVERYRRPMPRTRLGRPALEGRWRPPVWI